MPINAHTFARLEPPGDRKDWPSGQVATNQHTARFCLDRARVRANDFAECVRHGDCHWSRGTERGSREATALDAANARAFCAWRGERYEFAGRLPTILEHEAALRVLTEHDQALLNGTREYEWADDAAYPRLWAMREAPEKAMKRGGVVRRNSEELPRWLWNTHEGSGAGVVAFRCAYHPR